MSRLDAQLIDQLATGLTGRKVTKADKAYQRDPIAWMVDKLGIPERTIRWSVNPGYDGHIWDGTEDPLVTILESLAAWKNVGVEAGTGTQKTFTGACGVLWFLGCFDHSIVVTTAPKAEQLELNLWKEVGKLWPKFQAHYPTAELSQLRVRMIPRRDSWAMFGFGCQVRTGEDSATRAQGFHAEHMLIVLEEAPGIDRAIYTAFENTCTAPHNLRLALGNPDNEQDSLHQFCESPGVVHVRISALDHPNVVTGDASIVPGATSRSSIDRRRVKYGVDSHVYKSRVRGICPAESTSALITRAWCFDAMERARNREWVEEQRKLHRALGVDVANSENGDRAAIAEGIGALLEKVEAFACPNSNRLGSRVAALMMILGILPQHVGVDPIGVGAGCFNELVNLGFPVQSLNGGYGAVELPNQEEKFGNLRAQMYWQMREDLRLGKVGLPQDEALVKELTTPMWHTKNGKIYIEAKEDLKKRLRRSPDKADAAVYWNWARSHNSSTTIGGMTITF